MFGMVYLINYTDTSVMKFVAFVLRWFGNRRGAIGIVPHFVFTLCVFYALVMLCIALSFLFCFLKDEGNS